MHHCVLSRGKASNKTIPAVFRHWQVTHPTTWQELLNHHLFEVGDYLGARRQFVQPRVPSREIFGVTSKVSRINTIKRRRLVKSHERVGVIPVATRTSVSINDGDGRIRFSYEDVSERHAHGTRTYN